MKDEAGYTLLELLVVLAVMGLIAAVIPGMALPGTSGVRLSGKVEEVAYRLQRARERAIETGQVVVVTGKALSDAGGAILAPDGQGGEIRYYPDGSETEGTVMIGFGGRSRNLVIDPITGMISESKLPR